MYVICIKIGNKLMDNQNKYDKTLLVVSKIVMRFLMGIIVFCLIFGSIDLLLIIIKDLFMPPLLLIEITTLFTTFDLILTIAIGYELFKALHIIINSDKIPSLQIVQIAIIAIANKIITTNIKETDPLKLFGLAALMLALGVACFLIMRNDKNENEK